MSVFPRSTGPAAASFVIQARAFLRDEYVPKIVRCLRQLHADDVWWRPDPASNSVANLVLHICGNARQWITAGVGGRADVRVRSAEFETTAGLSAGDIERLLTRTFDDVDQVLGELEKRVSRDGEPVVARRVSIQGFDVSVLQAVFHVVEHVSGHTGQILYITKVRTGRDLGFYAAAPDGTVKTNW